MVDELFSVRDDGSVILAVHAQPGAGRSAVVGRHGDALKVRVAARPEGGRANAALVKLLSEELGIPEKSIELTGGERNRSKLFRLADVDVDELVKVLERLVATAGETPGRSRKLRP